MLFQQGLVERPGQDQTYSYGVSHVIKSFPKKKKKVPQLRLSLPQNFKRMGHFDSNEGKGVDIWIPESHFPLVSSCFFSLSSVQAW